MADLPTFQLADSKDDQISALRAERDAFRERLAEQNAALFYACSAAGGVIEIEPRHMVDFSGCVLRKIPNPKTGGFTFSLEKLAGLTK